MTGDRGDANFPLDGDLDGEVHAEADGERAKPASRRLAAKSTDSSTKRACIPKPRTLVAVSLFPPARSGGAEAELADETDEDWAGPGPGRAVVVCVLSAERIC